MGIHFERKESDFVLRQCWLFLNGKENKVHTKINIESCRRFVEKVIFFFFFKVIFRKEFYVWLELTETGINFIK